MRRIPPLTLLGSLVLAGCAAHIAPNPYALDHPANPQAPAADYQMIRDLGFEVVRNPEPSQC